ncbi:MAG: BREX-1 system adenine-specific DNA-methyltransferase PglX [Desulfosporosinus sp.]
MNKTAIKSFAIWARNKLIAEITYKAGLLGITEKEINSPLPQSTQTVQFFDIGTKEPYSITSVEIEQRKKLSEEIQRKANQTDYNIAYKNVVEEVAYTWFNRLIAVRFMEVNDYLPTHIRVLSSESSNKSEPDLVTDPMYADLDYTPYEKDRIMQLKNDNHLDELFRMLFIKQCNVLNAVLPELFEKTNDFTELLMNVSFTDQDGVVYHLVHDILEDDFNVSKEGQVEIIGWMYQYYNTEPKDETFALLKKNIKITKERIPAATQLFTPDWIVRYMVENSLGRLWIEGHPNDDLKAGWKYYLDEAEQEAEVQAQLAAIREEYKAIKPEDIKVIDPCMGSGHILVYAFDVLMQIYESYGYSQRDAAKIIIENNLYGLDIDNRAYQLAYFAIMMKSRQYNRRILNGDTTCHIYAIQESNGINRRQLHYFGAGMDEIEYNTAKLQMQGLLDTFTDAKEYGSILNVESYNWELLYQFVGNADMSEQMTLDTIGIEDTKNQLRMLVRIGVVMAQKYDVVVTNPPYMGGNGMGAKLSEFVKKSYPNTKYDMSTVCMEKTKDMCSNNGYISMINIPVWMFLASYEKLRSAIISSNTIINMIHFGRGVFGSDFGTTAFVIQKWFIPSYMGTYRRLFEKQGAVDSVDKKEKWFFAGMGNHNAKQESFTYIPGSPVAYWVSKELLNAFAQNAFIGDVCEPRVGMATANNDLFIRLWHEVAKNNIGLLCESRIEAHNSKRKWFPFAKGGENRKWYGNNDYVVNWENDGFAIQNFRDDTTGRVRSHNYNLDYIFQSAITWTVISSATTSFRYAPVGFLYSNSGYGMFFKDEHSKIITLGFLNTKVVMNILSILSPTIGFESGYLRKIPYLIPDSCSENIESMIHDCIKTSKIDWDSYETSWDYVKHPLLCNCSTITAAFAEWQNFAESQFNQLKSNEKELNRIFIDIYGLQGELSPGVEDKDVTIRKADLGRDIRSFISYAVGCMFGRYSLDIDGLAYAGGQWDDSKYSTFIPDRDNILSITDEEYYEDDIIGLFCAFVKKVYGAETLDENLDLIAKALGNKGNSSREIIRNYFLKDFFKDHCKIYQKRPIYWLFDSGKVDGYKALVYMHRYNADTIGNLRIDYLHRMQRVYESEISRMQETIENSGNAREVTAATKRKEKLMKQLKETKEYDEKIAHLALARIAIDLDDGVKVNYEKVQTDTDGKKLEVLAKI